MNKIVLFLILLSISCTNNKSKIEKRFYYSNGNLKKYKEFSVDSVANGKYMFFYENGQLEDSANYINGRLHGESKEYYRNGSLKELQVYYNGDIRNFIAYDSVTGNIKKHHAYGYFDRLQFIVDYIDDSVKIEGWVILNYHITENIDLKNNDTLPIEYLTANPPKFTSKANIIVNDLNGNRLFEFTEKPDKFNRIRFRLPLSKKMKKEGVEVINYYSSESTIYNKILKDTTTVKLFPDGSLL